MKKLAYIVLTIVVISGCATQTENPKSETLNPKQTQNPNDQMEKTQLLIEQLDDNKPAVRESAMNQLILIGKPAEPYLQNTLKAIKGKNAEVEWRIKLIIVSVEISELEARIKGELIKKLYEPLYREGASLLETYEKEFDTP